MHIKKFKPFKLGLGVPDYASTYFWHENAEWNTRTI